MDDPLITEASLARVVPSASSPRLRSRAGTVLLAAGIVLLGLNLRPVFSSLSVVLPELMQATGVDPFAGGLLTTLPVLCLGIFAFPAPWLSQRFGAERVLLAVLLMVAAGSGLRGIDNLAALYGGTALAGIAIALGNTLLPAVVKRDFPGSLALMTGLFSMALCAGAAGGAAFTLPVEHLLPAFGLPGGYRGALAIWMVPALVAAMFWLPQLRAPGGTRVATVPRRRMASLMRDPLAWQVTLFMGLQSALAYTVFGWVAPILRLRGLDAQLAGFITSASLMLQVVASIFVPFFGARASDQRLICSVLALFSVSGFLGMMFAPPALLPIFGVLLGLGQGGLFAIAMTIIALRSGDASVAAVLSGMAQGLGYIIAAAGPLIMGALLKGDDFRGPALFYAATGLGVLIAGLGAGQARLIRVKAHAH